MSYHNTSTPVARSITNAQGQTAPTGYHYMPDGSLMLDSAHVDYAAAKIIKNFYLDTSNIKAKGENRSLKIQGDNGAIFSLEIRNGASFYNFQTNLFQTTKTKLHNVSIVGGAYNHNIKFPNKKTTDTVNGAVTSGINVVMDTVVANTMEVGDRVTGNAALDAANVTVAALDPDGDNTSEFSLSEAIAISDGETLSFAGADQYDVYLTAGENTKHSEYQEVKSSYGGIDANLSTGSNSAIITKVLYQTLDVALTISGYSPNGTVTGTNASTTITVPRGGSANKIPFNFTFTATSTRSLSINKQPQSKDIMAFITATVGDLPITIPGENIYPAVTTAADSTSEGGTTVDGSSTGTTVTTHVVSSTIATVGDRVLGNAALAAATVTVTAVSSGSGKTFTISESISIADDLPLTFSNQRNYRWPISSTTVDLSKITPGMRQVKGTMFEETAVVRDYVESIIEAEGTLSSKYIEKIKIPAIQTFGVKPVVVRDPITKVLTKTVGAAATPINITFDKQALRIFGGGASAKIFGYGANEIKRLLDYDVEFSDLAVVLTPVVTTTTAVVSSSTSVPIANRAGIMDLISSVSGIGIDPGVAAPTVASGAGSVTGVGTIVLSAAQTLENGAELTFPGAGSVVTISGNVKVNSAGNGDEALRFDLEKFLTMH